MMGCWLSCVVSTMMQLSSSVTEAPTTMAVMMSRREGHSHRYVIDHSSCIGKDAAPYYSFPPTEMKTMAAAAARTAVTMDGVALQSFGVPVNGMGGLTVSMVG